MTEALVLGFIAFICATVLTSMLLKFLDPYITAWGEKGGRDPKKRR